MSTLCQAYIIAIPALRHLQGNSDIPPCLLPVTCLISACFFLKSGGEDDSVAVVAVVAVVFRGVTKGGCHQRRLPYSFGRETSFLVQRYVVSLIAIRCFSCRDVPYRSQRCAVLPSSREVSCLLSRTRDMLTFA